MRLVIICLLLLLSSCASVSKIEEVEQKIQEGQNTIAVLDEKIVQLESDKQALQKQLEFIDVNDKAEAIGIREKITRIDESITGYKKEIVTINSYLSKHSAQISSVQTQQKNQSEAVSAAVEKNEQIKKDALDEIRALEKEYEERRKKKNEDEDTQEE